MRFGIPVLVSVPRLVRAYELLEDNLQDEFIQIDEIWLRKSKVVILQRFRQPEALHGIYLLRMHITDIVDDCMSVFGASDFLDIREQTPGSILEGLVTCYAIQNKDGLDSFGPG